MSALRYDRIIVMEIFAKCADQTGRAFVYASDVSWIDMNVVAELRNRKAQLESDIAELSAQASQLWEAIPSGVWFEYDGNEDSEAVPPCSFWPTSVENRTAGSWTPALDSYSKLGVTAIDGRCAYCESCDDLEETSAGNALYVSALSSVCGWLTRLDTSYLFVALAKTLKALSRCKGLLSLVIAAVTVLLKRLKSAARRCAIATCQRNFFTHHGAHPPRPQPLCISGLIRGRVFKFRFVT